MRRRSSHGGQLDWRECGGGITPDSPAAYTLDSMNILYLVVGVSITAYAIWRVVEIDRLVERIYQWYRWTPERAKTHWSRRKLVFLSYAQSRIAAWAVLLVLLFVGITTFLRGAGVDGVLDRIASSRLILLFVLLALAVVYLYGRWHKDNKGSAEPEPDESEQ